MPSPVAETRQIRAPRVWLVAGMLLTAAACRSGRPLAPGSAPSVVAAGAPAHCFDVDRLSAEDRVLADRVLLEFGDREGLYTLAGGLKPISSDSAAWRPRSTAATSVSRWRCSRPPSVSVTRAKCATPRWSCSIAAPRAPRWRGYGYLFGYPDDAVDFFVAAGIEGDRTGALVPRDFRRIETVHRFPSGDGPISSFVFAVTKGSPPSPAEQALRAAAAPLYARYTAERARRVRPDSTGAVALWRAWLTAPSAPTPR